MSEPSPKELLIIDTTDPRSVINLVPDSVKRAIQNTPEWYLDQDAYDLRRMFKAHDGYVPTFTDNRLRIAFWQEYESAQRRQKTMLTKNIWGGVCSDTYFEKFLRDKQRVAWMLCPPADYTKSMEEALLFGIDQLREILAAPHEATNKEGELIVDARLAMVKVEIVKMIDQRVKGSVIQRTQNIHAHLNGKEAKALNETPETLDQIEQKIAALEAESRTLSTPGGAPRTTEGLIPVTHKDVIDVESTST